MKEAEAKRLASLRQQQTATEQAAQADAAADKAARIDLGRDRAARWTAYLADQEARDLPNATAYEVRVDRTRTERHGLLRRTREVAAGYGDETRLLYMCGSVIEVIPGIWGESDKKHSLRMLVGIDRVVLVDKPTTWGHMEPPRRFALHDPYILEHLDEPPAP